MSQAKIGPVRGLIAIGVLSVTTIWLSWEGLLGFYIHPRYNLFTTIMAVVGTCGFIVAASFGLGDSSGHGEHRHGRRRRRLRASERLSAILVAGALAAAIILPPTTLSSFTAENRKFGSNFAAGSINSVQVDPTAAGFESLTVRDWAGLLSQTQDSAFFRGKPVKALGVISNSGNPDVFLLSRFVVTCCAVDAQPVSIPVYMRNWQDEFEIDSWVTVSGGFQFKPEFDSPGNLAVVPVSIEIEEVPDEPYLF